MSSARKLKVSPVKISLRRRKKALVTAETKTDFGVVATFIRRVIKIFSKLVTPKKKCSVKKCYKKVTISSNHPISTIRHQFLPPPKFPNQKTVFLDLDDTLIHAAPATSLARPKNYDFVVKFMLDGEVYHFYVLKRPFVDEFLKFLNERNFEIVVFTASMKAYANLVLDQLDKKGLISHRLYRNSCKVYKGNLVKDLSGLGRDLKKVMIVDDNPNHYCLQPKNGIQIKPFSDDLRDDELKKLMKKMMNSKFFKI